MIMTRENTEQLNIPEQVSDKSVQMETDAFFEHVKKERENHLSVFSRTMDSEEYVRLRSALVLFDDVHDVSGATFERCLEQYFDTLVAFLEAAVQKQDDRAEDRWMYQQAVEDLYLINSGRVKRDNSYRIYNNHPILLMNRRLEMDTEELLKKKDEKAEENGSTLAKTDYEILRSVFEAKRVNRRRMKLYSRNMVYETNPESFAGGEDYVCALPFKQQEYHTEVPLIRIWEKIKSYLELHPGKEQEPIRIAVFGKPTDTWQHGEVLEKLLNLKIEWTFFRHAPIGEYFFMDEVPDVDGIYDLLDMTDLQDLVDNYEIILFLDQNCFYKQGQAEKDVREKSAGTYCRWNFDRSRKQKEFKDKAAFYQVIYNRVGQWTNAVDSNMSASFEFDERLYRNLKAVSREETDIYLYLRYGGRIGGYSLSNNGICNDEYYNGLSLTVCRLTKADERQFNEDYRAFLDESAENITGDFYVPIRFWKLLKSVSNQYCDNILQLFQGNDGKRLLQDIVPFLNESYLILKYVIHPNDEKVGIRYKLLFREDNEFSELQKPMKEIAHVILKYAFNREKLYCVNRYFENLLIHSVISNANDIGDLIFAHWMATHWYRTERLAEDDSADDYASKVFSKCKHKFKVRKTVYSIIEQLGEMRMRDASNMKDYFFNSFRGRVCPEVTSQNAERTFGLIRAYCERFQYTSGYLYVNSKLIQK